MSQGLNLNKVHKKNKSTSDLSLAANVEEVSHLPLLPLSLVNNASVAVENNKRICRTLMGLIQANEAQILKLRSRKKEENFPNESYYNSLSDITNRIKNFIIEISQINGLKKYAYSSSNKETLDELFKEYNNCINLLNFSLNVDTLIKRELDQEKLEEGIQDISSSLNFLVKKINKLEFSQERQESEEENLQEKLKPSLEQITELSKQSKQVEESLTKKEQEITDLEILIEYKQNNINENEIRNSSLNNEEERMKLEKRITDLKNQIVSLQNQLIEKGKELANLNQENNKLIEQCLFYLTLIKSFREKQKELEEKKKN